MPFTANWNVVFGEQPTAAKWNQLGDNDDALADGTGISAGVITPEKLVSGAGTSWAWASYSPTWGVTSGTAPAIGNGTIAAAWVKVGKLILFRIRLTAGSTTTFGSGGGWRFSLPAAPTSAYNGDVHIATGNALDTGTASTSLEGRYVDSSSTVNVYFNTATTGAVTNAQPHAWANTDIMFLQGFYETA